MRAMSHPDYVYRPWSPERRAAASRREKVRHAKMTDKTDPTQDFIDRLIAIADQITALEVEGEEALCAVRYFERLSPERAEEIYQASSRIAKMIGWD